MTFVTLVLIQFFNAYNCRSDRSRSCGAPFANRWLNMAVAWELVAARLVIVYVPFFQRGVRHLQPDGGGLGADARPRVLDRAGAGNREVADTTRERRRHRAADRRGLTPRPGAPTMPTIVPSKAPCACQT